MRLSRLFSASLLVTAVTVLASCGESTTPAATNATDPSLGTGTREYSLSANPTWQKQPADPLPTDSRTVLVGGLIAAAGYPFFGAIRYTGGGVDWFSMSTAPSFSRNPLGWNFVFRLKPSAASLPIGVYTATIPVNVPAATNNPQLITVTYNNCNNCLFVGDSRDAALTGLDPKWNRSSTYNNSGGYPYDDWRVFVPPFTTVQVDMIGSPCGNPNYTHSDPYQYVFTTPALAYVTSDDDAGCGYNSIVSITNSTATQQEYLLRATSYSSAQTGTYNISVEIGSFFVREKEAGDK